MLLNVDYNLRNEIHEGETYHSLTTMHACYFLLILAALLRNESLLRIICYN